MSNNEDFKRNYDLRRPVLPVKNIAYINNYLVKNEEYEDDVMKQRMSNYSDYSYQVYTSDIQEMRNSMGIVSDKIKETVMLNQDHLNYIFDPNANEWSLDSESINKNIDVPEMDSKHMTLEILGSHTKIPPNNAYAIIALNQAGYVPNEQYFKQMEVTRDKPIYAPQEVKYEYIRTPKEKMYAMAGGGIVSMIRRKLYGKADD